MGVGVFCHPAPPHSQSPWLALVGTPPLVETTTMTESWMPLRLTTPQDEWTRQQEMFSSWVWVGPLLVYLLWKDWQWRHKPPGGMT